MNKTKVTIETNNIVASVELDGSGYSIQHLIDYAMRPALLAAGYQPQNVDEASLDLLEDLAEDDKYPKPMWCPRCGTYTKCKKPPAWVDQNDKLFCSECGRSTEKVVQVHE